MVNQVNTVPTEEQRFMAYIGLMQWTEAVVTVGERIRQIDEQMTLRTQPNRSDWQTALRNVHTECHFFAIAAYKLLEYATWSRRLGLFRQVDFSAIDSFPADRIRDLRNMREHVVEYFKGAGNKRDRWFVTTPEFKADASSVVGTMIGGRLDWVAFSQAAERLLPVLLAQPVPYPSLPLPPEHGGEVVGHDGAAPRTWRGPAGIKRAPDKHASVCHVGR